LYFDQFEFLGWFSDKPTIFSTLEGEKMVMHFSWHLPQHFEYLFHFPDKIFLFSAKNLLLFLNNFYKFHAQNEWENIRQKIPPELGLYDTIFTLIATNLDSCSWHTDSILLL
jgi:hypothetical protein